MVVGIFSPCCVVITTGERDWQEGSTFGTIQIDLESWVRHWVKVRTSSRRLYYNVACIYCWDSRSLAPRKSNMSDFPCVIHPASPEWIPFWTYPTSCWNLLWHSAALWLPSWPLCHHGSFGHSAVHHPMFQQQFGALAQSSNCLEPRCERIQSGMLWPVRKSRPPFETLSAPPSSSSWWWQPSPFRHDTERCDS